MTGPAADAQFADGGELICDQNLVYGPYAVACPAHGVSTGPLRGPLTRKRTLVSALLWQSWRCKFDLRMLRIALNRQ